MSGKIAQLLKQIQDGDFKALARGITLVENEIDGYNELLLQLNNTGKAAVVGITGPPGAGKSTLVNGLLHHWIAQGRKIAVVAVDPSSPFNYGALLGDRIRMSEFYTNSNVFIRSLASRGQLGGLNAHIIEITDLLKTAPFDVILVETVGVGQSEVEIAGLADCTVVALVPQAGDEVQTIKAGVMEIADIFVVNKADDTAADALYHNLRILAHERAHGTKETPVIKTIATSRTGIDLLASAIDTYLAEQTTLPAKRLHLMAEKSWQLIQAEKMKGISYMELKNALSQQLGAPGFNIYSFVQQYLDR